MRKTFAPLIAVVALVVGVSASQREFNKHSFLIATASDENRLGLEGVEAEVTVCDVDGCESRSTNPKGIVNFRLPTTDTSINVTVVPNDAGLCPWSATLSLSGEVETGLINHYVLLSDCDANTP